MTAWSYHAFYRKNQAVLEIKSIVHPKLMESYVSDDVYPGLEWVHTLYLCLPDCHNRPSGLTEIGNLYHNFFKH